MIESDALSFLTLVRESRAIREQLQCLNILCLNISYILISSSQRQFRYLLYKELFHITPISFINSFSTCELKNYCGSDIILSSSQNSNIPVIRDAMNTERENVGLLVNNLCHCINSSITYSCPRTVSHIVTV